MSTYLAQDRHPFCPRRRRCCPRRFSVSSRLRRGRAAARRHGCLQRRRHLPQPLSSPARYISRTPRAVRAQVGAPRTPVDPHTPVSGRKRPSPAVYRSSLSTPAHCAALFMSSTTDTVTPPFPRLAVPGSAQRPCLPPQGLARRPLPQSPAWAAALPASWAWPGPLPSSSAWAAATAKDVGVPEAFRYSGL